MLATVLIAGTRLSLICQELEIDWSRRLDAAPVAGIGRRYAALRDRSDTAALRSLGVELYHWLDGPERWLDRLRAALTPPFLLEVQADPQPDAAACAVLQAPWELLADKDGFLAEEELLRFAPVRRLGRARAGAALDDYRLGVAFMAAAPRGAVELDHEAEETAIQKAVPQGVDLWVEDSGDPEELGRRITALDPAPPLLHLSCHGHNAWTDRGHPDRQPQPVLMMEDAQGSARPTPAPALIAALRAYRPRLLFVSACLTAAATPGKAGPGEAGADALADSLASTLVRAGVPAVLGWDGSVADVAATAFAHALYDGLSGRQSVGEAAARARRALLLGLPAAGGSGAGKEAAGAAEGVLTSAAERELGRRDWHLARVWLGPAGGGPVVGGRRKRSMLPPDHAYAQVLVRKRDSRLVVADPAMFVGRRRELQVALSVLRGDDHAGLLLHGMGRLGKTSLAARIASRLSDLALAVVYGDYGALDVLDALAKALQDHPPARSLLAERRAVVRQDAAAFEAALIDLLAGPCAQAAAGRPVLLLIDDLERILEPEAGTARRTVRLAEQPVLAAVLRAFDPARSDSRLVVTSRFPFAVVEDGIDLAGRLFPLQLGPFSANARRKLSLRQGKAALTRPGSGAALDEAMLAARLPLLNRAESAARGNPGLQDLIGDRLVLRPAVAPERADAVLREMEAYLSGGALPGEEAVRKFLQNLAVDELLDQAGAAGRALLRATLVFEMPVPSAVVDAVAAVLGGGAEALRALGLLDPGEDIVDHQVVALAVNGLVAGRLEPLTAAEAGEIAGLALPALLTAWGGTERAGRRAYAADLTLSRLGLRAGDAGVVAACAQAAVRGLSDGHEPEAAALLGQAAITRLEQAGLAPSLGLLADTAAALGTKGDGDAAAAVLAKGSDRLDDATAAERESGALSLFLFVRGNRQVTAGELDAAQATFERLCALETARANLRQLTIARGQIADILRARGELDEALRTFRDEVRPAFERLGDVHQMAVTKGRIADILEARGELDEALRIRRQDQLPVYERLGDVREAAVTKGKIADILFARGDLAGALDLQQERLQTNRRLGDIDGIASALWAIARIELEQGKIAEAVPRVVEAWTLLLKLGRVEGIAAVGPVYGQMLAAAGQKDEGLSVLRRSADAWRKLGRMAQVQQVDALIAHISGQSG